MTDHEALNAAITAAGLDPNNHLVRKASQVLVEKYNEARNAEAEAWNIHAKGWGEEIRYTKAGAEELADRLRTIAGVKEPMITPLFAAPPSAFTLSDASRLLRKQDVQGACPHPDDCFYESDRVRCGPCAVKASAAKGVEIDDTHSHLPEVCRLRREVKAATARIAELEAAPSVGGETVKVKPLEWDAPDSWNIAKSVVGTYVVRPCLATNYRGQFVMRCGDEEKSSLYPSEEAAKNAAQADFERRIRSALEDAPFIPAVIDNPDAGISELVIKDTPTVTGSEMTVRPLYRMSDRQIIGFQWDTASLATEKEKGNG
ncbi:hypothetical protein EVB98_029 [Rhizobium phage RHph_N3_2]|nr:hypothetical protein EVB98_029 [Rhizobium phage RHph_N3_2]QIG75027.1 hypothetical protein EVC14_029 [Rhizobium phage RHph_I3_18]